jgi:hypothetical protein
VGRSIYRHVMNLEEEGAAAEEEGQPPSTRQKCAEVFVMPDLDVPEGVLEALSADGQVLLLSHPEIVEQLGACLPQRHSVSTWTLLYSSALDGYSLATLYRLASERGPVLLFARDTAGGLCGAYLAHHLRQPQNGNSLGEAARGINPGDNMSFYGSGETFLFEVLPMSHLPPLLDGSAPPQVSVCAYRWAHLDDLFVCSSHDFLAVGGGGGHYGLRIDADLQTGRSGGCATFKSPPLGALPLRRTDGVAPRSALDAERAGRPSTEQDDSRFFELATVEVWSVSDWELRQHVERGPQASAGASFKSER